MKETGGGNHFWYEGGCCVIDFQKVAGVKFRSFVDSVPQCATVTLAGGKEIEMYSDDPGRLFEFVKRRWPDLGS